MTILVLGVPIVAWIRSRCPSIRRLDLERSAHEEATVCDAARIHLGFLARGTIRAQTVALVVALASLLAMMLQVIAADQETVRRLPGHVVVTKDCTVDGGSTLIYKVFLTNSVELVTVVETTSGRVTQFQVPSKAMTPVLMSSGICVPCSDGEVIFYALDGTRKFSHFIPETIITDTVRVSDRKLGVVGMWWKEDKKAFELTVKLLRFDDKEVDVTTLGVVPPRGGTLVSPDPQTLWWLHDKESRRFAISSFDPKK